MIDTIGGLKMRPPPNVDDPNLYMNGLFYGDTGVGKTKLCSTCAEVESMCPVLYLNTEDGDLTLAQMEPQYKKNLQIVDIRTVVELQKVYDDLRNGKHGFKTTIIDSAPELQDAALDKTIGQDPQRFDTIRLPDGESQHWQINTNQLRLIIKAFRGLPMHVIFTASAMEKKDPRTKIDVTRPGMSPKVSFRLPGQLDFVYYMYTKEGTADIPEKRFIQTGKSARVVAKSRIAGIPYIVEEPTMGLIHGYLMKYGKVDDKA